MSKQKKDSQSVTIRMDKEIFDQLNEFIEETRLSKTAAIEKAVQLYLENYKKTKQI